MGLLNTALALPLKCSDPPARGRGSARPRESERARERWNKRERGGERNRDRQRGTERYERVRDREVRGAPGGKRQQVKSCLLQVEVEGSSATP